MAGVNVKQWKRLMRPPGGDMNWVAGFSFLGGLGLLYLAVTGKGSPVLLMTGCCLFLTLAVGLWFRKQWARWTLFVLWGVGVPIRLWQLVHNDFAFRKLWLLVVACWFAWVLWRGFEQRDDDEEKADDQESDDRESRPPVSLVALLRTPLKFDVAALASAAARAWGEDIAPKDVHQTKFNVAGQPVHAIQKETAIYSVLSSNEPYFPDREHISNSINELRSRGSLLQHSGWIAVDLTADFSGQTPADYKPIARLLAELMPDDVLAVYHPGSGILSPSDATLRERLRDEDPLSALSRTDNPPVIQIDDREADLVEAVAKARSRWPEFVAKFRTRDVGHPMYAKFPLSDGGTTEFIWIEVVDITSEGVSGHLGNEPVNLPRFKIGDSVQLPLSDLNDWLYVENGNQVGGFTIAALTKSEPRTS